MVAIYFSAHWCPPCRGFTPQLAQLYKDVTAAGKKFGVLFVSSDRDEKSFEECVKKLACDSLLLCDTTPSVPPPPVAHVACRYFHEMPWVALDFGQRELKVAAAAAVG